MMASRLTAGAYLGMFVRKPKVKMACAIDKATAPPKVWLDVRMAMAAGISDGDTEFWTVSMGYGGLVIVNTFERNNTQPNLNIELGDLRPEGRSTTQPT